MNNATLAAIVFGAGMFSNLAADFVKTIFDASKSVDEKRLVVFFICFLIFVWFLLLPDTVRLHG